MPLAAFSLYKWIKKAFIGLFLYQDRIQIVPGDVQEQREVVQAADVLILNNVFEFFISPPLQARIWCFLRANTKKGTLIVTIPSLEDAFHYLEVSPRQALPNRKRKWASSFKKVMCVTLNHLHNFWGWYASSTRKGRIVVLVHRMSQQYSHDPAPVQHRAFEGRLPRPSQKESSAWAGPNAFSFFLLTLLSLDS